MSLGRVGSCICVVGMSHLVLLSVVAVRLDYVPWYGGLLNMCGWNESLGTAVRCSSEVRPCPLVGWALVYVWLE